MRGTQCGPTSHFYYFQKGLFSTSLNLLGEGLTIGDLITVLLVRIKKGVI